MPAIRQRRFPHGCLLVVAALGLLMGACASPNSLATSTSLAESALPPKAATTPSQAPAEEAPPPSTTPPIALADCMANSERVEIEYEFTTFVVNPETGEVFTIGEGGELIPGMQNAESGNVRLWDVPVCVYEQADGDGADAPTKRNLLDALAIERGYYLQHDEKYTSDLDELSELAPELFGTTEDEVNVGTVVIDHPSFEPGSVMALCLESRSTTGTYFSIWTVFESSHLFYAGPEPIFSDDCPVFPGDLFDGSGWLI